MKLLFGFRKHLALKTAVVISPVHVLEELDQHNVIVVEELELGLGHQVLHVEQVTLLVVLLELIKTKCPLVINLLSYQY